MDKFSRTASSVSYLIDVLLISPQKQYTIKLLLKAQRELLKVTNQRCVGHLACTLRSSFSAELGALAGHHI